MTISAFSRKQALAAAIGFSLAAGATAQSTTGSLYGHAPVASGESVLVENVTGFIREIPFDDRIRNPPTRHQKKEETAARNP